MSEDVRMAATRVGDVNPARQIEAQVVKNRIVAMRNWKTRGAVGFVGSEVDMKECTAVVWPHWF